MRFADAFGSLGLVVCRLWVLIGRLCRTARPRTRDVLVSERAFSVLELLLVVALSLIHI